MRASSRPLRIQVDARLLRGGGIGRYIREITGPWLSRPDVGAVRFMGRPEELEPFLQERDPRGVAEILPWRDGPYSLVAQLRWPFLARRSWEPDVSFFPHYDVPLVGFPAPSLVAIHDLIHFQRPEGFPAWKRVLGQVLLRKALESATSVVTVSETSRHAICDWMPAVNNKIHVVKNGVGSEFRPLSAEERVAARSRWTGLEPFVLCVGPNKPHKNLEHAGAVLAHLPSNEGWRLVLVGPSEADRDRLLASSGRPELGARTVVTGRVSDEELRSLYGLAAAVLVPSRLEGFGLPVVEARACGTRVLVADLPWTREVAQEGVTLMPGWDAKAWADEIRIGREIPPLSTRPEWRWAAAADRTFEALRQAREVGEQAPVL
jgi:glycosyltransferase involved in cell wall biosynthesis